MTEPSPTEIQFSKPQEVQKKKKTSKKKAEPKTSNPRTELIEGAIPDLRTEADFDLIHYTYKLEQQVSTVKRQLRQQKKKFREVIHGLAKYFDEKGVSSHVVEEYMTNLGTQIADTQDRESEYEKYFTVHKYLVVEDPNTFAAKSLPKSGQKAENGPKNPLKPQNNIPKLDTTEIDLTASVEKGEKTEKEKDKEKEKEKKKQQKAAAKAAAANTNGTEEAPKKRKYTKHKQSEESNTNANVNAAPDIQEIPPFSPMRDSSKKSESKVKKAEDMIRSYEDLNQKPIDLSMLGQQNFGVDESMKALFQQMGIDPTALMNPYLAGNFGIQGRDIYDKLFQELMKASTPNPMLNTDKARQELFNYYQGNFK